ncbi:MAG: type II toxin-antitoxin system RelE/ParE family toxin [Myxococcota bacterium]
MTLRRKGPRQSCASGVHSASGWLTVVETPAFQSRASGRLSQSEVEAVISTLAKDPTQGPVITGTGGVRKVRVAIGGRGKSGGARVIYYFYNRSMPLFLLTVFAKNEQANLTQSERNLLSKVVTSLRAATEKGR